MKRRRTKEEYWVMLGSVILIGLLIFIYKLMYPTKPGTESMYPASYTMQQLDPRLLEVPSYYKPIPAQVDTTIYGKLNMTRIDSTHPKIKFSVKDAKNTEYWLTTELVTSAFTNTPTVNNNMVSWSQVFPSVDLQYQTYDGYLKELFILKSKDTQREFTYKINTSENVELDTTEGGMITIRKKDTKEELFVIRAPQGIDSDNNRIDYKYTFNSGNLVLTPAYPWQLDKADYPVKVDPPIQVLEWTEALVQVGENCADPACGKDGDIIAIHSSGWNWGISERKAAVIVKIPKLTQEQRTEYTSRTLRLSDLELKPGDPKIQKLPQKEKDKIYEIADLPLYAINYTQYATKDELSAIRNKSVDSPILDLRYQKNSIQKKTKLRASIVPDSIRLAYQEPKPKSIARQIIERLVPKAFATTTVVKTIGSNVGRNYSSIATWESTEQGTLTSLDEIHEGDLYNDSTFTISTGIHISGSTTDATRYMILTAATASRHSGVAGSGVVIDCNSATGGITLDDDYSRAEWFEIKNCIGSAGRSAIDSENTGAGNGSNLLFQNLIVHGYTDSNSVSGFKCNSSGTMTVTIRNSIFYAGGANNWAVRGNGNASCTVTAQSLTMYGGARGIYEDSGVVNVTNSIAMNTGTQDFVVTNGTQSYNMSEDTSATGTGSLISKSISTQFVSTSTGCEDFHLVPGSDALNTGNNLYATFTSDVDGGTRPAYSTLYSWEIGADDRNCGPDWYACNWSYRKKLTVDVTKVSGGSNLTDFPMLVSQTTDADMETVANGGHVVNSSGNDILFTTSDGKTRTDHEIEKYTASTGELASWVRVPTLSGTADTVMYMYYGSANTCSQQSATAVWDTNYKGVWHMSTSNMLSDSTSSGYTLTNNGTATSGTGQIDGDVSLVRSSSQYLERVGTQTNLEITGNLTIEAWAKTSGTITTTEQIATKDGTGGNNGYWIRLDGGNARMQFQVSDNGTNNTSVGSGISSVTTNTWYHVAGVYNGTNIILYLNGGSTSTAHSTGIFNTTATFEVGARNGGSNLWDGDVDEVRVSNTARSAGWIVTEYNNTNAPSTFYAKSTEQTQASTIKTVQNGSATIASGSTSQTATITTVDMSRSFVTFGIQANSNDSGCTQISGAITNSTTLTFTRRGTCVGVAVTVEWYVAEFTSGVWVQRGTQTMDGTTRNATITNTDLSKAFPIQSYEITGTDINDDDFIRGRITTNTNYAMTTISTNATSTLKFEIVEFSDAKVQYGDVSFATGDSSKTATITSVNPSASWLLVNYNSATGTAANIGQKMIRAAVTNSTTLTFDRNNTGQTLDLTYYNVEFTNKGAVQTGNAAFTSSDTAKSATLTTVTTASTIALGGAMYHRGGKTAYSADDNPGVGSATFDITSTTNLTMTRALTGSATADIQWFVIDFSATPGATPTDTPGPSSTPTNTPTNTPNPTNTPTPDPSTVRFDFEGLKIEGVKINKRKKSALEEIACLNDKPLQFQAKLPPITLPPLPHANK
ncbi:MAG: hypothetical protein RI947_1007 [Candidatus Parcubacteria bacterium]|jgi:hypothetical protein